MRRLFAASALAAAAFLSGCQTAGQRPDIVVNPVESAQRVRIGDTAKLKAGLFFKIFGDAEERAGERSLEEELLWMTKQNAVDITAERREAAKRIADKQRELSADELAWTLSAAFEGTLSEIFQIEFVRAIKRDDATFAEDFKDMSATFHESPGRVATKPLGLAVILHRVELHAAAEMFRRFPPPVDLSGRYVLATSGDCAVAPGRYELEQRGRVFELVDGGHIAMYGAVGASRAFFVPNDQRYARIARRAGKQLVIRYPDRNADIMQAKLETPDSVIVMHNRPTGDCVIVLKAIGGET